MGIFGVLVSEPHCYLQEKVLGAARRRRLVRSSLPPGQNSLPEQKAQRQALIYWTQVLIPRAPDHPPDDGGCFRCQAAESLS